jgi:hypothetical protein
MKANNKDKDKRDKKNDGTERQFDNHRSNDKTPPRFENFAGKPTE